LCQRSLVPLTTPGVSSSQEGRDGKLSSDIPGTQAPAEVPSNPNEVGGYSGEVTTVQPSRAFTD